MRTCHSPATFKRYSQAIEQLEKLKLNRMKNDENGNEKKQWQEIIDLFKLPSTALAYHEKKYSFDNFQCITLLPMCARDQMLPHQRLFWNRLIGDSHDNNEILGYMGEMFHHWCFHDMQFSFEIVKVILEGIDRSDSNRLRTFLSMMDGLISINEDNLSHQRFDKLFNCDSQCIGDERINSTNLNNRFFASQGRQLQYATKIDVFDLIQFYTQEHKNFAFQCIEKTIQCVQKYKHFAKLFFDVREGRWKNWDLWLKEYCLGMQ